MRTKIAATAMLTSAGQANFLPAQNVTPTALFVAVAPAKKRGRPRHGEVRAPAKELPITRQRNQTLLQILLEFSTACNCGAKCNATGCKIAKNGYRLRLDTADYSVPISALLPSASMHDSRAAVPLSLMGAERVMNLCDVANVTYCSVELQAHSHSAGHVPLIDHNPRGGVKDEFKPADAIRYKECTVSEHSGHICCRTPAVRWLVPSMEVE